MRELKELENVSIVHILHVIENDVLRKNYTYIIMGKNSPTGKSWLCNQLKERGFKAIELSEYVNPLIEYNYDENYLCRDDIESLMIIILNKPY